MKKAAFVLLCLLATTTTASAQTIRILSNGTLVSPPRYKLNFISGSNATASCVDGPGTQSTNCTIASTTNGTITSLQTTLPIVGGTITTTGTLSCPTCALTTTTITAGSGLTGGGDLSANRTLAIDTSIVATLSGTQTVTNKSISGSTNTLSAIANGSLTNSSITVTTTTPLGGAGTISLGGTLALTCTTCVTNSRQVLAGTGLSGGGALSADITLNLPNVGPGATTTGGSTLYINSVTTDAQGRIASLTTGTPSGGGGSVITDATLTGAGTSGSHLGLNLANANTWTGYQTFGLTAVGTNGIYWDGSGDTNWITGLAAAALPTIGYTRHLATGNAVDTILFGSSTTGATWGASAGDSILELTTSGIYHNVLATFAKGITNSGSTSIDFSGGTGTFKFPTGLVTLPVATGTMTGTYTLAGTPSLTAPTITGSATYTGTFRRSTASALGTTIPTTPWIESSNTTAAAAAAQQISGTIEQCGAGWKTTATAASQVVCNGWYTLPIQGTAAPTTSSVWYSSIAGGTRTGRLTLDYDGTNASLQLAGSTIGIYYQTSLLRLIGGSGTEFDINSGGLVPATAYLGGIGQNSAPVGSVFTANIETKATTKPTVVCGAAAGTAPTCTVSTNSTNTAGTISIVSGTVPPTGTGTLATMTLWTGADFNETPTCDVFPANAATALIWPIVSPYFNQASSSASTVVVSTANTLTGIGASTTYLLGYLCMGASQ